jgi:hypothetical protein
MYLHESVKLDTPIRLGSDLLHINTRIVDYSRINGILSHSRSGKCGVSHNRRVMYTLRVYLECSFYLCHCKPIRQIQFKSESAKPSKMSINVRYSK